MPQGDLDVRLDRDAFRLKETRRGAEIDAPDIEHDEDDPGAGAPRMVPGTMRASRMPRVPSTTRGPDSISSPSFEQIGMYREVCGHRRKRGMGGRWGLGYGKIDPPGVCWL